MRLNHESFNGRIQIIIADIKPFFSLYLHSFIGQKNITSAFWIPWRKQIENVADFKGKVQSCRKSMDMTNAQGMCHVTPCERKLIQPNNLTGSRGRNSSATYLMNMLGNLRVNGWLERKVALKIQLYKFPNVPPIFKKKNLLILWTLQNIFSFPFLERRLTHISTKTKKNNQFWGVESDGFY